MITLSSVLRWCLSVMTVSYLSNSRFVFSSEYESDSDSYWRSISDFTPTQNTSYGEITLRQAFYLKFDLIWHGFTEANPRYAGIIRIGNDSNNVRGCHGHATRFPALYLDRRETAIQFSISDTVDCWGVTLLNATYHNLQVNTKYTITMHYNRSWSYIRVNNQVLHDGKRAGMTPEGLLYTKASVLISDALAPAANVTLSNITMLSYDHSLSASPVADTTQIPTLSPTDFPSVSPTVLPSLSPTILPTASPTSFPTEYPSKYPTRFPTHFPSSMPTNVPSVEFASTETLSTYINDISDTSLSPETSIGVEQIFIVEVFITLQHPNGKDSKYVIDNSAITAIIYDLLAASNNLTNITVHVVEAYNDVNIEIDVPVHSKQTLDTLTTYLTYNFTLDLTNAFPNDQIGIYYHVDAPDSEHDHHHSTNVNASDTDPVEPEQIISANTILAHILDQETITYALICVLSLFLCSLALCVCLLCRYCSLQNKMKTMLKQSTTTQMLSIGVEKRKASEIQRDGQREDDEPRDQNEDEDEEYIEWQNPIAGIAGAELQQLSHSTSCGQEHMHHSTNDASLDFDDLNLPRTSEGGTEEALQDFQVKVRIPGYNDDAQSPEPHMDPKHSFNFVQVARPDLHNFDSVPSKSDHTYAQHQMNHSNLTVNASNLDIMIEDQRKLTNHYSNSMQCSQQRSHDELEIGGLRFGTMDEPQDEDEANSLASSSSDEALYDEGRRRSMLTKTIDSTDEIPKILPVPFV